MAWDLTRVIERAYRITPEIQSLKQTLKAKYASYRQAGKWPNPTIEFQSDNRLEKSGIEDGQKVNEVAFSQSISLTGRYGKEKRVAYEAYRYSIEKAKWMRLELEAKASQLYYEVQITKAKLDLAKKRLAEANKLQSIGKKRHLAGDLSRFNRERLNIVKEKAYQQVWFITTQYKDAKNRLIDYLSLKSLQSFTVQEYSLINLPNVDSVSLNRHPRFKMAKFKIKQKQQERSLSKASRLDDINVRVFQEQDEFSGKTETVTGIGFSIPLPLWNTRRQSVKRASAELSQAQFDLKKIDRDLKSNFKNRYIHLKHLIRQTAHYKSTILRPANRIFKLSKKSFRSGDTNILTLLDAVNTYYEAQDQYLDLINASLTELIRFRLAAGIRLNPIDDEKNSS